MEFFIAVGMSLFSALPAPRSTDFIVVVSGDVCTPCKSLMPLMDPVKDVSQQPQLAAAWSGQVLTSCAPCWPALRCHVAGARLR